MGQPLLSHNHATVYNRDLLEHDLNLYADNPYKDYHLRDHQCVHQCDLQRDHDQDGFQQYFPLASSARH